MLLYVVDVKFSNTLSHTESRNLCCAWDYIITSGLITVNDTIGQQTLVKIDSEGLSYHLNFKSNSTL